MIRRIQAWFQEENRKLLEIKVAEGKASENEINLLAAWNKQKLTAL